MYLLAIALYNITLHPLASFPGPKLRGAFYFPQYWNVYTGDTNKSIKILHDRYGHIVRITPSLLSFNNAIAWRDIHGYRQSLRTSLARDLEPYGGLNSGDTSIVMSNNADHTRIRRVLSNAFSEQALRAQEPYITEHIDLLIDQLCHRSDQKVDLVQWYNFTTFDVLGDLGFGESFHALERGKMHPWVGVILDTFMAARWFRIFIAYPLVGNMVFLLMKLFPQASNAIKEHRAFVKDKVDRRLDRQVDRKDILSYIQQANDKKAMSHMEIVATSGLLIIAGSESTATWLSGITFLLLSNPEALHKVMHEVRSTFSKASDMSFQAVATQLPYLNACLNEAARYYPPVPSMLPRKVEIDGLTVGDVLIPKGAKVGIHPWSVNRSSENFKDPDRFVPERWMGDKRYQTDNLAASQPFIIGPKACLGRNLAWAEGRSIIAKMLWNFDMEMCEDQQSWDDQRVYFLWHKTALNVVLKLRDGASIIGEERTAL